MPIVRINEFQAAEGQADALFDFLKTLAPYLRASEGCMACEVLQHHAEPDHFVVLEKWTSIAAHQQALARYPKAEMQAALPLFGAPPKGAYYARGRRDGA